MLAINHLATSNIQAEGIYELQCMALVVNGMVIA